MASRLNFTSNSNDNAVINFNLHELITFHGIKQKYDSNVAIISFPLKWQFYFHLIWLYIQEMVFSPAFCGMLINRFSLKHWKSWIKYTFETTQLTLDDALTQANMAWRDVENFIRNEKIKSTPNSPSDRISELKQSSVKSLTKSFHTHTRCVSETVETVFAMAHPGSNCILSSCLRIHMDMHRIDFISNLDHISCSMLFCSVGVEHISKSAVQLWHINTS